MSGSGISEFAVLSMSARSATGDDAAYLEWHMLDHLPEQYQIDSMRHGQRFVSTPACRAVRAAAVDAYDDVEHLVTYLFAEPVGAGLTEFFELGPALHAAGRMPFSLPRRHVVGYDVVGRHASPSALVADEVVPWRPNRGLYLLVEQVTARLSVDELWPSAEVDELLDVDGVAGAWLLRGSSGRHPRLEPSDTRSISLCYLDADPADVGERLVPWLERRWQRRQLLPMLATPMVSVVPWQWDAVVP